MTSIDADVVVVGGGHNGLVDACYPAKAAHRVALLEVAPQLPTAQDERDPEPAA